MHPNMHGIHEGDYLARALFVEFEASRAVSEMLTGCSGSELTVKLHGAHVVHYPIIRDIQLTTLLNRSSVFITPI